MNDRCSILTNQKTTRRPLLPALAILLCFAASLGLLQQVQPVQADGLAQQPTVAMATVTGTPVGPMASVNLDQNQIHVRSGPGPDYPIIGILVQGQKVPAYGTSPGNDWILIGYQGVTGSRGWVHATLVTLSKPVPVATPPPTPTAAITATLDPTLAARYLTQAPATRLPTFTPPPPVVVSTYAAPEERIFAGNLPVGFIIIGLAVIGLFGTVLSFLRGR